MKDGERLLALSELTLWARAQVDLRIEMQGEIVHECWKEDVQGLLDFNKEQCAFWQRMLKALEATLVSETGRGPQVAALLGKPVGPIGGEGAG